MYFASIEPFKTMCFKSLSKALHAW